VSEKSDDLAVESALAGKYMTFRLATEEYGLGILKVRELIGMMDITRVPRAPAHVRGVINLRGKVIPVVDLRVKFSMVVAAPTNQSVIIVVQLAPACGGLTMGILVDEVLEVRAISAQAIEPPPNLQDNAPLSFLLGVAKAERGVIFLLDIDRVLTPDEREPLGSLSLGGMHPSHGPFGGADPLSR
jgi:purine-binding chemotaxis protein CheW